MLATIVRQDRSQSRSVLAASFISAESNLPTSAAVSLHASAQAAHEWTISGLCLAIMQADRLQKPAQSDESCTDRACSFFPSATCMTQWWKVMSHALAQSEQAF